MLLDSQRSQELEEIVDSRTEKEVESLGELVRKAIEDTNGDFVLASKRLEDWARRDVQIYHVVLRPYLARACWEAVRLYARRERRVLMSDEPHQDASQRGERALSLAQANESHLMNTPLPLRGCPRLGDANKAMLIASIEQYEKKSSSMLFSARWLCLVRDRMKDLKKKVREQMKESDLAKCMEQARKQDAQG